MSDEFRRNLMGPEPTLLPAETDVYGQLDAGQEALDLVEKHPRRAKTCRSRLLECGHRADGSLSR